MPVKLIPPRLLLDPRHLLALGFGSGLSPWAPGTAGTVVAIPLYLLSMHLPVIAYLGVIAVGFALGVYLCAFTARVLGVHDHPGIVWDEVVGFFITMIAAPAGWIWIVAGFVLFRFFDIVKPWPIRWLDRHIHGGLGIMLDDVLAGLFAWAGLQLCHFLL